VIGIDDGPFGRRERWAPLVGVLVSIPQYVEAVRRTRVRVDGDDATEATVRLLDDASFTEGARAVLLDGIAVGGFNLLDLDRLHRETGRPVVTVTRRPPDFDAMRSALRTYFPREFRRRWRLVRAHPLFRVRTGGRPLWASAVGCRRAEAIALLERTRVRGYWPEPLRLARLVARAFGQGPVGGDEFA
jgi:endonuclease V-like protein UPF0215 family